MVLLIQIQNTVNVLSLVFMKNLWVRFIYYNAVQINIEKEIIFNYFSVISG